MSLGWRRLVGWLAAGALSLVFFGYITGADWLAFVVRLIVPAS